VVVWNSLQNILKKGGAENLFSYFPNCKKGTKENKEDPKFSVLQMLLNLKILCEQH